MAVKAYVWTPVDDRDLGHASLQLSDGTYISWWPLQGGTEKYLLTTSIAPGTGRTLQRDIDCEGREPDRKFVLPDVLGLNEEKMKKRWEEMKTNETWQLTQNNCSTAVKKILSAGGLKTEYQFVETPAGMAEFFDFLVQNPTHGPRTWLFH